MNILKIAFCTLLIQFALLQPLVSQDKQGLFEGRPDLPGDLIIGAGLNFFSGAPDNMALSIWGSKTFSTHYYYPIATPSRRITIAPGLGISAEKYDFSRDVLMGFSFNEDDVRQVVIEPWERNNPLRKSRLTLAYVELPLEFRYRFSTDEVGKGFRISVGVVPGVLINSHQKLKFSEESGPRVLKDKGDWEFLPYRINASFRVGWRGFGAYFQYGLTPLFTPGRGPEEVDFTQLKMGLQFNLF